MKEGQWRCPADGAEIIDDFMFFLLREATELMEEAFSMGIGEDPMEIWNF